jgi:hypothetical protein
MASIETKIALAALDRKHFEGKIDNPSMVSLIGVWVSQYSAQGEIPLTDIVRYAFTKDTILSQAQTLSHPSTSYVDAFKIALPTYAQKIQEEYDLMKQSK